MIELQNITKIYKSKKGKETVALADVSFQLPQKGLVCLLGKSGCGKSTLLNILGLLDEPTEGKVLLNNQDIYKYGERKVTNYRSSEIGFIFQEFNLFEELNVYDNISLALDLNGEKKYKEKVHEILKKVQLDNYATRKINELSGGEKQRVAIARALIKNPSIILADEPTGNLDTENSEIIFSMLKEISQDCLVVLVTHDKESASRYADKIIELSDGKVINDTFNETIQIEETKKKLNKSHIKLFKRFKFALGMLSHKKLRLIFTILIISLAFTLLGVSLNVLKFDIPRMHAETMQKEGENEIVIKRKGSYYNDNRTILTDYYLNKIENIIGNNYITYSRLVTDNQNYEFKDFIDTFSTNFNDLYYENAFYQLLNNCWGDTYFISYSKDKLENFDIIGEIPTGENEILISEALAEYLVAAGFYETYYDEKYKAYMAKNVIVETKEELINKKVHVRSGINNTSVENLIIKGIIKDENLQKYEPLKNEDYNKMKQESNALYKEFEQYLKDNMYNIIVNDNFFEIGNWKENDFFEGHVFPNVFTLKDMTKYNIYNFSINSSVTEYENGKIVEKYYLKENEVYFSSDTLNRFYGTELNTKVDKAITNAIKEYEQKLKEREDLLASQEQICNEQEECVFEEIPEVEIPDTEAITKKVTEDFIKEKELIGATVTITVKDPNNYVDGEEHTYELIVAGFVTSNSALVNEQTFAKYKMPNQQIEYIKIAENNPEKLQTIFKEFAKLDDEFSVETKFSKSIEDVSKVVSSIEKIAIYIALGLLIFATILFTLFITSNTNQNKKKIGILRAIGTKVSDIIKIFMLESVIIVGITFVLSNILTVVAINVINSFITREISFYLRPIVYEPSTIIVILVVQIIVTMISLVIPIIRLSKSKPIELINHN